MFKFLLTGLLFILSIIYISILFSILFATLFVFLIIEHIKSLDTDSSLSIKHVNLFNLPPEASKDLLSRNNVITKGYRHKTFNGVQISVYSDISKFVPEGSTVYSSTLDKGSPTGQWFNDLMIVDCNNVVITNKVVALKAAYENKLKKDREKSRLLEIKRISKVGKP